MAGFDELRDRILTGPLEDLHESAEVVDSTVSFAGRVWDVRTDRVRLGDAEFTRDYVDHTGAVAIAAVDDEGRLLLINQYRHPIRSRDWELPAGLLDIEGEAPERAAQRELAEEADLAADEWTHLADVALSPGGNSEIIHIFEARGLRGVTSDFERADEEAEIVTRWFPIAEVVDAALAGRIRNGALLIAALALSARDAR